MSSLPQFFPKKDSSYGLSDIIEKLARIASNCGASFEISPTRFKWTQAKKKSIGLLKKRIILLIFLLTCICMLLFNPELFLKNFVGILVDVSNLLE